MPEPARTAVLNAANEEAVAAFLDRRIGFDRIHGVNRDTLDAVLPALGDAESFDALLELDRRARAEAGACIARWTR